jgi:N utilization substance protein A
LDAVRRCCSSRRGSTRTNENYIAELNEKTGSMVCSRSRKSWKLSKMRPRADRRGPAIDPAAELESEVRIPKSTDLLGRISAQTAKQVIFQKVREAERETIWRILRRWANCELHDQARGRAGLRAGPG